MTRPQSENYVRKNEHTYQTQQNFRSVGFLKHNQTKVVFFVEQKKNPHAFSETNIAACSPFKKKGKNP